MTPLAAAGVRAVIAAVVVAGLAGFTALAQGSDPKTAGIQAGAAFFGVLVVRFGGEGVVDQVRLSRSAPTRPAPGTDLPASGLGPQ